MPAYTRIKTYTKTKKNHHYNYSTTSQNSFLFPITGASIAIDSLLAKNIEKRNSSLKENTKNGTKNSRKTKKEGPRLLVNDSFDLSINTTFEKLLKAPDLQPVKYCNISALHENENTRLKHDDKPLFKVQKTYERRLKTNVLSLGKKIKENKTSKRSLLQMAKKKTPEITPNGSNCFVARKFTPIASTSSIALSAKSNISCSVFQPGLRHCMQAQNSPSMVASTPIIPRHLRSREDISISPITAKKQLNFQSGWKSLFDSDFKKSTESSLPSTPKKDVILINSTLEDAPPLQTQSKPKTKPKPKSKQNNSHIQDDLKFKAIPIVILENGLQISPDKLSPRVDLTRHSFTKYREKIDKLELLKSPYVDLTRHSFTKYLNKNEHNSSNNNSNNDKIKINLRSRTKMKNTSAKKVKNNVQIEEAVGLRTRSHLKSDTKKEELPRKTRTVKAKKQPEKRTLRSNSTYLDSSEITNVSKKEDNNVSENISNSKKENISISQHISKININISGNNSISKMNKNDEIPKRVLRSQTIEEKQNDETRINKLHEESIYIARIIEELKKPVILKETVPEVAVPIRRSSRARKKSVLIDEENYSDWGEYQRITQNKTPSPTKEEPKELDTPLRRTRSTSSLFVNDSVINTNTIINISDDSAKSLFSSQLEDTLNNTSKRGKFITKRRGSSSKELKNDEFITRRRGSNKSENNEDINQKTISLHEWERFSQNNISTVKIDDAQPQQNSQIIDNSVISDTFAEPQNVFLKPGKQWLRSLSILRRTNIHNIPTSVTNKGRKWRESVCAVFEQQNQAERLGGVLFDTSDNQHNEIFNISTKNLQISRIHSLSRRTTLQIVPLTTTLTATKGVLHNRNVHSLLEDCDTNKTGYVSTLADESQSILANFDKLSLTTNVDEREETARQIILKRCGQTHPLPFDDCYSQRSLTRCRKIGEGVYGEVFMYKCLDRQCRVMKIIPIEGNLVVNGEHQKKFEEIISEIIIASELSNLRNNKEFSTNGFNELLKICCVQGKYPQHLLDLWNLYDEEQGSENDSPELFTDEQLYIVLELANGGQDLEAYRFNNAEQSYAVFAQVVCSLAVAESALQFEHRDMHWGNILISPTNETTTTFRLNGRELEIATKGVNVSIIDFTLSRMTYNNCCIFNDLALDPDLFTATGDYQFDIYRLMRKRNLDDWQRFEPYSNILWLDYTLEKMITQLRYLRINTKTHKTYIRRLTQLRKKIFNYNSATELLNSDAFSQVFLY